MSSEKDTELFDNSSVSFREKIRTNFPKDTELFYGRYKSLIINIL